MCLLFKGTEEGRREKDEDGKGSGEDGKEGRGMI